MGWGAAAMIGGSLLGNVLTNDAARSRAHDAQDFSAEQYATRWQTTVKDMQAAGLNPMLAYTQGVGSSPQGVQAPVSDYGDAIEKGIRASTMSKAGDVNSAQKANIDADTENKKATTALIDAQTQATLASAGQSVAMTKQADVTVDKIVAETKNAGAEYERIWQMVYSIAAETGLARANTKLADAKLNTETYTWAQIQAITAKVLTETGMMNLDFDQLKRLDNVGKMAKELRPVVDLIRSIIDARKASR